MMAEQLELVRAPLPALRPFWRYYGGKWRAAPLYPQPLHRRIVEPFAGAAGYALRYPDHEVVLVEAFPPIAEIWRWLIAAEPHEVLAIPCVDCIDDMPSWVPAGARWLARMVFANGDCWPRHHTTPRLVREREEHGYVRAGWSPATREHVARQVPRIKHWRVIEGSYELALELLDRSTTTFVDPPYFNKAGQKYPEHPRGTLEQRAAWYAELGRRCLAMPGQVIVCENEGASWLPFRRFGQFRPGMNGAGSREVVYHQIDGEERSP